MKDFLKNHVGFIRHLLYGDHVQCHSFGYDTSTDMVFIMLFPPPLTLFDDIRLSIIATKQSVRDLRKLTGRTTKRWQRNRAF